MPQGNHPRGRSGQLPLGLSCITGASAAASACVFSNPFDVAKTRMQLAGEMSSYVQRSYRSFSGAIREIFQREGFRGIQAGLSPAVLYQIATHGTRLGLYPKLDQQLTAVAIGKEYINTPYDTLSPDIQAARWAIKVLTGTVAGMLGSVVGNPLFLLKTRLQAQSDHLQQRHVGRKYRNFIDVAKHVFEDQGMRGFFTGTTAALFRVGVGSGVQLSTYDTLKSCCIYYGGLEDGPPAHFIASFMAGILVVAAMNPFDVISTRMYNQQDGFYRSPIDCAIKTVRKEGIKGLYKGSRALYIRSGPHTILVFLFLEQYKKLSYMIVDERFSEP